MRLRKHGVDGRDRLTGLLDRRALLEDVNRARQRAESEQSEHVLLYCDVNDFRNLNAVSGRVVGDEILRAVAETIGQSVRSRDSVAHVQNDEFAIVLHNCSLEHGQVVADTIEARVAALRVEHKGREFGVRMNVGITLITHDGMRNPEEIVHQAEQACEAAKRSGRGTVRVYAVENPKPY